MYTIRQPMLAAKSDDTYLQNIKYPVLCSPKIDGIRGIVVGGKLLSRSMKPIRNTHTQSLFGRMEFEGLDGELCVGNPWDTNLMQQTSSGVMSISGCPRVTFNIFDKWNLTGARYEDRYWHIKDMFNSYNTQVIVVNHLIINSYEELLRYEAACLAEGYEGIMIRALNGKYKDGRSTLKDGGLVKVKRFTDGEAIIIGYEPLMRNNNELKFDERGYAKRSHSNDGKVADEMLGALHVKGIRSDVSFSIGSGFTDSQRRNLWDARAYLVGRIVKYKHFTATGVKDAPRMPIFLSFRNPEDM